MTVFIDRSNVNGADDYAKAPVTHIYLKASEGTGFTDSTYQARRQQALAAGAKVGAYHFAGHNDPTVEADFFLSRIEKPHEGDLRPCLDLESGQSRAWAERFVARVKQRLGYYPTIYGSTSFIGPMRAGSATLKRCPWWRAEYGPNDGLHHALSGGDQGAAAHQYTSVAEVPGISGPTDASVLLNEAELLVPAPAPKKARWDIKVDGRVVKTGLTPFRVRVWEARHRRRFSRHHQHVHFDRTSG